MHFDESLRRRAGIRIPAEVLEEEERLSPVGMIVRQRRRYATEAALVLKQAQRLLH